MTARVFHADLWGTRQAKYDWLNAQDVVSTRWKKLAPDQPFYLFVPQDVKLLKEYEGGPKITDIMPVNSVGIVSDGAGDLKKTFGLEDVFHYAYAVFHSPTYRSRYAQFLKIDFPRLPLTSDRKLFATLCALGAELVGLHLLEKVPAPAATYPQAGDSVVDKPRYCGTGVPPVGHGQDAHATSSGRVYVNARQYFDNVPPQVWEFHVGGYQVCEKWLKDRKGRRLAYDDVETYRRITEAIRQTLRIMGEIDDAIPSWPLL